MFSTRTLQRRIGVAKDAFFKEPARVRKMGSGPERNLQRRRRLHIVGRSFGSPPAPYSPPSTQIKETALSDSLHPKIIQPRNPQATLQHWALSYPREYLFCGKRQVRAWLDCAIVPFRRGFDQGFDHPPRIFYAFLLKRSSQIDLIQVLISKALGVVFS